MRKAGVHISYLFTYWVLSWTILYFVFAWGLESKFVKYNFNPLLLLICESVIVLLMVVYMFVRGVKPLLILKFLLMGMLSKGIPVILLLHYQGGIDKIRVIHDTIVALVFFIVYIMYLKSHNMTLVEVYQSILRTLLDGTYRPGSFITDHLYKRPR
jgi:hypothetical protein